MPTIIWACALAAVAFATAVGTVAAVKEMRGDPWRRKSAYEVGLGQIEVLAGTACTVLFAGTAAWLLVV
jgi:hypothetical protein